MFQLFVCLPVVLRPKLCSEQIVRTGLTPLRRLWVSLSGAVYWNICRVLVTQERAHAKSDINGLNISTKLKAQISLYDGRVYHLAARDETRKPSGKNLTSSTMPGEIFTTIYIVCIQNTGRKQPQKSHVLRCFSSARELFRQAKHGLDFCLCHIPRRAPPDPRLGV